MAVPNQSDHYICQFAVISDSHIRLIETAEEGGYQSNLLTVERAQYVVQCLNNLQPDFVIHLGDLVHPIPDLKIHEETVKKGRDLFSNIEAKFYALPGNHDIGDKPNAWLPAPVVGDKSHLIFEKYWGPTYQSFSTETCHFICLDTPIMNTGFEREKEQRSWLENELLVAKNKSLRIFIFMHYPLFICEPDEPTHYDNIDFPARSWLLEKFSQYNVEAVFSGHVHNAFVGIHAETLYYSLPSIAFVRPEYSELATVGPGDEYGRNDMAKLGFYLVRVYRDRHEIYPIRTYGAGNLDVGMPHIEPCQMAAENSQILGLTLRRGWGKPVELAADGLDEFKRKEAYRDGLLVALLELGVRSLRVPFADLANPITRQRLSDFVRLGFEFTVYSLGVPDKRILKGIQKYGSLCVNWELIFPEHSVSQMGDAVHQAIKVFSGQIYIAPVVPIKKIRNANTFQHFASHGFSGDQVKKAEKWLSMVNNQNDHIGLTFRVSPWDDPGTALHQINQQSNHLKLINLQLPRLDEGVRFEDDQKTSVFVVDAFKAGRKMKNTTIFLDTFLDSDRGYYPRNGLLDRRFNPRPAFYALKLASMIPSD